MHLAREYLSDLGSTKCSREIRSYKIPSRKRKASEAPLLLAAALPPILLP